MSSKGEFTDDTSMALAMADAFIDNMGSNGSSDGHQIIIIF